MSQENVEVVRQAYDALDRGDAVTALSLVDPEVVIDATHRVDGRVGHGHQEMIQILSEWLGTWDEWHQEVEEIRDLGDQVLVISLQSGVGTGSGVTFRHRFAMVYSLKSGRITRWTIYDDPAAALEAVGLSE